MKEYLALRAVSYWQLTRSLTFSQIALCHSNIPLHHGDSAVVVIFILQKSENSSEENSPALLPNTFDVLPKKLIQFWKTFLIMIGGFLLLIMLVLLTRVNFSIIWKYQIFLPRLWRSIATVWLSVFAFCNPTIGLGGGFLWVLHTTQLSQFSLISFEISVENNSAFLKRFFKLLEEAWPNCLCKFWAFFILVIISLKYQTIIIWIKVT